MADDGNKPLFQQVPFAFPFDVTVGAERHINPGMTLRDYFAGQALAGLLANTEFLKVGSEHVAGRNAAPMAYAMADAMLRARETP